MSFGEGLQIAPGILVGEDELLEQFIRSSGPGGQNVNKVATAVQLRFDVAGSTSCCSSTRGATAPRSATARTRASG